MEQTKISKIEKIRKYCSLCGLFLCPIVHFYLLEAYTHNGFIEVRTWSQIFNILLFEFLAVILFFLFRTVRRALMIQGILAMVVGLANYYVYTFRSLPLVPWDILSIQTAASVAGEYDFTPTVRVVCVFIGFAAVLILESFLTFSIQKWKWYESLVAAVAFCLGLGAFAGVLQKEDFQNKHLMYNKLFTPVYMWQVNGFALTMVMELPYLAVEKPKGYQREAAKEQLESYETHDKENLTEKPNIIVVMNEAFSDLSVFGDFTPSEDYMPYFHSMFSGAKNTVTGYLHVSVCGGNTANTEFEFLTGNTMAFLPQGSIPYQQYINSEIPSIPSYLRDLGYETYAMHPYLASGWDRDKVYPLLGFSSLEFLDAYTNREYVRNFVSDMSCMEKIIKTYEQKEADKPMFLFNVTMQNHGSYSDTYENFTPNISVEGASSYSLSTYLSLIQKSDEALKYLISYFSSVEEPVMIVFFGDHQPNDVVCEPIWRLNGKSYRSLSQEDTRRRYQVPYLIWTNYDMETENGIDMSVNYFGGKMLELAGLNLPAYQNYLSDLGKRYPVVSAVSIPESKEAAADLEEYKKLQYYQLFDLQD